MAPEKSYATAGICTLGCRVNQYESEALLERLTQNGVKIGDFADKNDIYIINTCTVTSESDRKSRQMIRRALSLNPDAYIIVTGCLIESDIDTLRSMPGVDIICGNACKGAAADAALEMLGKGVKNLTPEIIDGSMLSVCDPGFERMNISGFSRTRAYIKIQDGCDGKCSYCIIPSVRGRSRSRPLDDIVEEVRRLADNGCREVVLTGIETSDYRYGQSGLPELAEKINEISAIERIRFGSLDPSFMRPDTVSALLSIPKCMPHFHLSLQNGSDRILRSMRRKYNTDMIRDSVDAVRKSDPDAMITADIIAGFPGEEESDIELTADLIRKARLLHSHIFTYSKRNGTPAAEMEGQIPERVKSERAAYLESAQAKVREEIFRERIGRSYEVLFETVKGNIVTGHSGNFIPVKAGYKSDPPKNEIRQVRIIGCDSEGLTGSIIQE